MANTIQTPSVKLYYQDPLAGEFTAHITNIIEEKGRISVELDQTLFYPEGGGQPSDKGTLIGSDYSLKVDDVQKKSDHIYHYLTVEDSTHNIQLGDEVKGSIDQDHRKYYAIQHSGQHLVSSVLKNDFDIETLSVGLGPEFARIEINRKGLSSEEERALEAKLAKLIEQNIAIHYTEVHSQEELSAYPLRRPPKVEGSIRLVLMGEEPYTDCSACGGIHTEHTGMIGMIKISSYEKVRGNCRLCLKIGQSAYDDYGLKTQVSNKLSTLLTAPLDEHITRVEKLLEEKSALSAQLRLFEEKEALRMGDDIIKSLNQQAIYTQYIEDISAKAFKKLVSTLQKSEKGPFFLTRGEDQLQWVLCFPQADQSIFKTFQESCLTLINGKGGGRAPIWQGSGQMPQDSNLKPLNEAVRSLTIS